MDQERSGKNVVNLRPPAPYFEIWLQPYPRSHHRSKMKYWKRSKRATRRCERRGWQWTTIASSVTTWHHWSRWRWEGCSRTPSMSSTLHTGPITLWETSPISSSSGPGREVRQNNVFRVFMVLTLVHVYIWLQIWTCDACVHISDVECHTCEYLTSNIIPVYIWWYLCTSDVKYDKCPQNHSIEVIIPINNSIWL